MIFHLFLTFLLQQTSAYCPEEKTVGDICYTRVEYTDTAQYGCFEGCAYKKTEEQDSNELYCFKKGSLPVTETECGVTVFSDFYDFDAGNEIVTLHNNLSEAVTVNTYCNGFDKTIPKGNDKEFNCNIDFIDGHFTNPNTGNRVNCFSYRGGKTFHPKYDINPIVDGCLIQIAAGAESDSNIAMEITSQSTQSTPQSTQSTGAVTVKNNLSYDVRARVYCRATYDLTIQPDDTEVNPCIAEYVTAYYRTEGMNGMTVTCEEYIGGSTYRGSFIIENIGNDKCEILAV